ncbi:MAG: SdpI family protein [Angustibacter sp.]
MGTISVSIISHLISKQVISGTLEPNSVIGIRTKHTQSSAEAWARSHRRVGPWLRTAAITGYFGAALSALLILVGRNSRSWEVVAFCSAIATFAVTNLIIMSAGVTANRLAKKIRTDLESCGFEIEPD